MFVAARAFSLLPSPFSLFLGARRVIRFVRDLLFGQRIDVNTHGFEFECPDLLIEFNREVDDPRRQIAAAFVFIAFSSRVSIDARISKGPQ